jgi:glycosyltransferase involved in cell wall biosynthesis
MAGDADAEVAVLMSVHASVPLAFVEEAAGSILQQTYRRTTLMLVCDGPVGRDVDAFLKTLPIDRVRISRFERNRGLPAALNHMLDIVVREDAWEFVARMDADDVSAPDRIAKQVAFLRSRPDVGIVGTWCVEIDERGRELFEKRLPTEHDEMLAFMATRIPLIHPSVMVRASVFSGGTRYDESLRQMQDYDLWSRLAFDGVRMANIPEALLRFRVDANFYARRAGWSRAVKEARLRHRHMVRFGLMSLRNRAMLLALLALRVAPRWAKRLAYQHLR